MKLLKINENSILIELQTLPQCTAETVRDAFRRLGITAQEEINVVCFSGNGGVLIFATQTPPSCIVYRFETVEDVIGGAQIISNTCTLPSTLIYCENAYFLILPHEIQQLAEFGNIVDKPEETNAYLQEYGTVLCKGNAIEKLALIFHT